MGQQQPSENMDSFLFSRLDEYKKVFETEQEMYSNVSRLFRDVFFVSEGQMIDNIIFFDNGRTKPFKSLEEHVTERVDALFETTVSDPHNDEILAEFIQVMKMKYKVIVPTDYPNRDDLDERIKELALLLCKEVKTFFDGTGQNIDQRCEMKIREVKRKRKNNLVYLGELKGCGICRHRSILFKLLCDIFGIPCRILRGWFVHKKGSDSHMWNEIVISKQRCFTVDSRNFEFFVPPGASIGGQLVSYMNLGHPHRSMDIQRMTSDSLQKLYTEKGGKGIERHLGPEIGKGAFASVRELKDVMVIDNEFEKIQWVRRTLAVKEVNISDITRYESNQEMKERFERIVKKEVDRMTLLQHPNITRIYGHFCTEIDNEKIVRVVMKKYDKNGDEFLKVLGRKEINPEKREIEVLIFLLEVLKGLKYIHSFGIVHFDIKPQNILLNWDEKNMTISDVVISDFGSSKDEKMNFNLTSAPTITRQFAAPEILEMIYKKSLGQDVSDFVFSTSSDIYSFGVLMGAFLQYFSESKDKKKMMEIQTFCVRINGNERPKIDQILNCVGNVLENILERKVRREVFTWGESIYGVLGHGVEKQTSPKRIKGKTLDSSSCDIQNLFCGPLGACVLLKNGCVFSWSSLYSKLSLPRKIVQVAYNDHCVLYLDCEGSVWACGDNEYGLLTGKKSDGIRIRATKPKLIINESKVHKERRTKGYSKMVKISATRNFESYFCCVDIDGKLFTWGGGNDASGLKGHGEEGKVRICRPKLVTYFEDIFVVDCKMGWGVTLVLTKNGEVYSFGEKDCIGRELETKEKWISTPGIIGVLEEKRITKISTYGIHCGVLDSIGNCYLWGDKKSGYYFLPTRIGEFKNKNGDVVGLDIPGKHKFVQVQCGWNRAIFLLEEKTQNSKVVHHVLTEEKGSIPSVVSEFENKNVQRVCSRSHYFSVLVKGRKDTDFVRRTL